MFVVAAAEAPPPELAGLATTVDVILPWGSLLHGILGEQPAVLRGIASLLAPGGRVHAVVSEAARDHADRTPVTELDQAVIAERWTAAGLEIRSMLPLTPTHAAALRSTWARRLRLGTADDDRRTWAIDAVRVTQRGPGSPASIDP